MPDRVQGQERGYENGENNEEESIDAADFSDFSNAGLEQVKDDMSSSTTIVSGQAPAGTSIPPPRRPNQFDVPDGTSEILQPPQSAQKIPMSQTLSAERPDTQENATGDGPASQRFEASNTNDVHEDEQMLDQSFPSDQLLGHQLSDDPNEPIAEFDWSDLMERYRQKMDRLDKEEKKVYQEFDDLVQYFDTWTGTIEDREKRRSQSRLSTQMRYVQHEEAKLKEKGEHYNKVVQAFKTIACVLYGPDTASAPGSVAATTAEISPPTSLQHDRFFAPFLETKRSPSAVVVKQPALVKSAPEAYADIHSARCVVA